MRKTLLLLLCVMMSVGSWAQYYKFTASAQGNLYTAASAESVAETPKGALCNQSYYVKSDYSKTTAPEKVAVKSFNVKTYYVKTSDGYSNAYGLPYVAESVYATASATKLEGDELNALLTDVDVFIKNGDGDKAYRKIDDEYVMVQVGDICYPDEYYYWGANPYSSNKGSDLISWGMTKKVKAFSSTDGVYVEEGGSYIPLSSNVYEESISYYKLVYTDLSSTEKEAMAADEANFATTYVVSGLTGDPKIYSYDSETATYNEVHNGDAFLGDDAYYIAQASFLLRTPAELLALNYVYSVAGLVTLEPSDDGKTLTVVCSGDVCNPDDDYETTGYKFQNLASDWLFSDEEGTPVANGDVYVSTNTYYTRTPNYEETEIPTITKYVVKDGVYVYSYNETSKTYSKIAAGTDVTSATIHAKSGAETEPVMGEKTINKYFFQGNYAGYLYELTQHNPARVAAISAEYDSNKEYVWLNNSYEDWKINQNNYSDDELSSYATIKTFDDLNNGGYLDFKTYFISNSDVFKKVGDNYVDVSETEKPAADTNTYVTGIEFIVASSTLDEIVDTKVAVNIGGEKYYKGDAKTVVVDKEDFDESAKYYVLDGYNYSVITKADLDAQNKLKSETVANNYWEALTNTINNKGYETVVFKTKDGDAEKALICYHVTQALMHTTTVNALDYENVQIEQIEPATYMDNGSLYIKDTGTFVYGPGNYSKNEKITTLLFPEIKTADARGHKHVPSLVASQFEKLELIVMPHNATCIEKEAFTNMQTINTVILNDGLKLIGEKAFDAARLNTLGVPESMEYIGKQAFGAGYLHDVYFYGKKAPIVEMDAFGSKAYLNNNSVSKPSFADEYKATRNNYVNNDYMAAMMHLRTDLTPEERACFTDITRDYHVFAFEKTASGVTVIVPSSDPTIEFDYTDNGVTGKAIACNGNQEDTSVINSKAFPVSGANIIWAGQPADENTYCQNSGYYDKYVGTGYRWPSQADLTRAYSVATNNLLWDGKTSISSYANASAISYDSDCDGIADRTFEAGEQYIGMHQFVLVTGDVSPNSTPQEWDFNTLGEKNWYTICVPLNMTVAEVRETFGEGTQVCKFNNVTRDKSDKVKFYFTDEQCLGKTDLDAIAIAANEAYMIRPGNYKDATTKFVLPQYVVAPSQIPVPTTLTATDVTTGNTHSYTFIGQYNTNADGTPLYMQKYSYYLGNAGNDVHKLFFQLGETGKWKPFTCTIIPSDGQAEYDDFFDPNRSNKDKQQEAKGVNCSFGEDDYAGESNSGTTGVDYEIICGAENAPSAIYNVNGQYVGNTTSKLAKGVYIKNGKKFIVK